MSFRMGKRRGTVWIVGGLCFGLMTCSEVELPPEYGLEEAGSESGSGVDFWKRWKVVRKKIDGVSYTFSEERKQGNGVYVGKLKRAATVEIGGVSYVFKAETSLFFTNLSFKGREVEGVIQGVLEEDVEVGEKKYLSGTWMRYYIGDGSLAGSSYQESWQGYGVILGEKVFADVVAGEGRYQERGVLADGRILVSVEGEERYYFSVIETDLKDDVIRGVLTNGKESLGSLEGVKELFFDRIDGRSYVFTRYNAAMKAGRVLDGRYYQGGVLYRLTGGEDGDSRNGGEGPTEELSSTEGLRMGTNGVVIHGYLEEDVEVEGERYIGGTWLWFYLGDGRIAGSGKERRLDWEGVERAMIGEREYVFKGNLRRDREGRLIHGLLDDGRTLSTIDGTVYLFLHYDEGTRSGRLEGEEERYYQGGVFYRFLSEPERYKNGLVKAGETEEEYEVVLNGVHFSLGKGTIYFAEAGVLIQARLTRSLSVGEEFYEEGIWLRFYRDSGELAAGSEERDLNWTGERR